MTNSKKIAIIGGGAAGFFAAISAKENHPDAEVTIYEKSAKVLSKVKVSGGGRCNVTHACFDNKKLLTFYPRGANYLRKAFEQLIHALPLNGLKKEELNSKHYLIIVFFQNRILLKRLLIVF